MYMQSNQPYNKVENDSVWNGALIGGAMGGAAGVTGTLMGIRKGSAVADQRAAILKDPNRKKPLTNTQKKFLNKNQRRSDYIDAVESRIADGDMKFKDSLKSANHLSSLNSEAASAISPKYKKYAQPFIGTGKRRAITAGASVLAGGIGGGIIDSMNK